MTSRERAYRSGDESFVPGKSEDIIFTVSLPLSIWSKVAMVLVNIGGCNSQQRTAAKKFICSESGAIPATYESVSWPTWKKKGKEHFETLIHPLFL